MGKFRIYLEAIPQQVDREKWEKEQAANKAMFPAGHFDKDETGKPKWQRDHAKTFVDALKRRKQRVQADPIARLMDFNPDDDSLWGDEAQAQADVATRIKQK